MQCDTFDAHALLAVPATSPERLFPANREGIARLWRCLARAWHPDRNPDARAGWVFSHIAALHQAALDKLDYGIWDTGEVLTVSDRTGKQFRLRYRLSGENETGRYFVGHEVLAYLFENGQTQWASPGMWRMQNLPMADRHMAASVATQLPQPIRLIEGRRFSLMVLRKTRDFVPLIGLLDYFEGSVPARHAAWIVSGLLNLACFLHWAGLCHLAIDPRHCLASLDGHSVALTGGWWFCRPLGQTFASLPARTAHIAPPDVLHHGRADRRVDALLIRQTGLELLGGGAAEAPPAMLDYLGLPARDTAIADYAGWQETLWKSFGERRYTALTISADDIYAMPSR